MDRQNNRDGRWWLKVMLANETVPTMEARVSLERVMIPSILSHWNGFVWPERMESVRTLQLLVAASAVIVLLIATFLTYGKWMEQIQTTSRANFLPVLFICSLWISTNEL